MTIEKSLKTQKTSRNSLIELYRFFFAIWVVYYHDYLIMPKSSLFNHGYLAVDFFFILSGFFLLSGLSKYFNMSCFKGLFCFVWKRIKTLCPALIVGLIFSSIYFFTKNLNLYILDIFGYLWYVPKMFFAFAIIYFLKRTIKSKKVFYTILFCCFLICYSLLYTVCEGWGVFRAIGGICCGVLISKIPKLKIKKSRFNINIIFTILIVIATLLLAAFPNKQTYVDVLLNIGCFPLLIYFTNQLNCNCKILNFLGSLSFGLYAYQTILRVLEAYSIVTNVFVLLLLLITFTLADKIVVLLYKKLKKQEKM